MFYRRTEIKKKIITYNFYIFQTFLTHNFISIKQNIFFRISEELKFRAILDYLFKKDS